MSAVTERKTFLRPEQIRELLAACERHDAATFELQRDGTKHAPRYAPITPFVRFLLLTGLRLGEALAVKWGDVDGDVLRIRAAVSKTKQTRDVDLSVAPSAVPSNHGKAVDRIFYLTADEARAATRRLVDDFGAPPFSAQALRGTCSTYFTCAFNAWRSAKSIGHSVVIAERHYAGLVKVPVGCGTLEAAMGLL